MASGDGSDGSSAGDAVSAPALSAADVERLRELEAAATTPHKDLLLPGNLEYLEALIVAAPALLAAIEEQQSWRDYYHRKVSPVEAYERVLDELDRLRARDRLLKKIEKMATPPYTSHPQDLSYQAIAVLAEAERRAAVADKEDGHGSG